MIFIAGVGPRKKRLDNQPQLCPNCGLSRAYLSRLDNYFFLFFIPIFRIRKGEPLVMCERCGHATDETGNLYAAGTDLQAPRCLTCGETLAKDYPFCPYCGERR